MLVDLNVVSVIIQLVMSLIHECDVTWISVATTTSDAPGGMSQKLSPGLSSVFVLPTAAHTELPLWGFFFIWKKMPVILSPFSLSKKVNILSLSAGFLFSNK